jgi:hypothetical protein
MTDNVVKLGNASLPDEPVPDVVARLESLLETAKSGRLRGFAYATAISVAGEVNRTIGEGWTGDSCRSDLALGIMMLAYRYPRAVLEEHGQ